jgi:hypothetical protein
MRLGFDRGWCGKILAAAFVTALLFTPGFAQYTTDFESVAGSPGGTDLTGQDAYYIPAASPLSAHYFVYTYAGNTLGVPAHPAGGGSQFVAATVAGPPTNQLARAQRNVTWGPLGVWTVGFDVCPFWNAALPALDNIGSFSSQDAAGMNTAHRSFNCLMFWTDTTTATSWSINILAFASNGTTASTFAPLSLTSLPVSVWHRVELDLDFTTNRILEVRVRNLSTGATIREYPADLFLRGGLAPALPLPAAFRLFTGGGGATVTVGNVCAADNISIRARGRLDVSYAMDPVSTTATFGVTDGPASGFAQVFMSLGTIPGLYLGGTSLDFEAIRISPLGAFAIAVVPLDPAGSGVLALVHPTPFLPYALYFQSVLFTLPLTSLELSNAAGAAHDGAGAVKQGALSYSHKRGTFEVDVLGPAATPVEVVRVNSMGMEVLPAALSTTVPAAGTLSASGAVSPPVAFGEKVRLKVNGATFREIDG